MEITEQIIRDRTFAICADRDAGIRPQSEQTAIRWLERAMLWAVRHNRHELANDIRQYLDDCQYREPLKVTLIVEMAA